MRKEIAYLLIVAALVCGFLVGRELPRHHYQSLANGWVILDTSTGIECDLRPPKPPSNDDNAFFDPTKYATPSVLPPCDK
jgi:hypothetical protein